MILGFRSFQTRLLLIFIGLLGLMQLAIFTAVDIASLENTRRQITDELTVGSQVFHQLVDSRLKQLADGASVLASDFAFKQVVATQDSKTLQSALANLSSRVNADIATLVDLDYQKLTSTYDFDPKVEAQIYEELVYQAEEQGSATITRVIDGDVYHLVAVPVLAPYPLAWLITGFVVDDGLLQQYRELTSGDISLLRGAQLLSSSYPDNMKTALAAAYGGINIKAPAFTLEMAEQTYVVHRSAFSADIQTLLTQSLEEALAPYYQLQNRLFLLFTLTAVIFIVAITLAARNVTRPVKTLVAGVKNLSEGNYTERVGITRKDELGELAVAVNQMAQGLEEKDKIRDLLGKVVSPEIAEELIKNRPELGGEEREVSILFSDVRNFTTLCEGEAPGDILNLLNTYLSQVSGVIEQHGGVVDKYIGDAVMALFGAPIRKADDARRAVTVALEMMQAVGRLNKDFTRQGHAPISIGIGINTDTVVAGNMGSQTRMNYTVIGDGVNLASRLEGLTKYYGVQVIVSETTRSNAPTFTYRELDRVQVKGKTQAITIYEPMGLPEQISASMQQQLSDYHEALACYRQRQWQQAGQQFQRLNDQSPHALYQRYLQRIEAFQAQPPGEDWKGVMQFDSK